MTLKLELLSAGLVCGTTSRDRPLLILPNRDKLSLTDERGRSNSGLISIDKHRGEMLLVKQSLVQE